MNTTPFYNNDIINQVSNYMDNETYKQFNVTNQYHYNLSHQDVFNSIINQGNYSLLLELDLKTLKQLSRTNRRIRQVLHNNNFWYLKFKQDQDIFVLPTINLLNQYTNWYKIYNTLAILTMVLPYFDDINNKVKFYVNNKLKLIDVLQKYNINYVSRSKYCTNGVNFLNVIKYLGINYVGFIGDCGVASNIKIFNEELDDITLVDFLFELIMNNIIKVNF